MTIVKAIALLVAVSGVTLGAGAFIGKAVLVHAGEEKVRNIVDGLAVGDQSIDTVAIQATRQVHHWYTQDSLVDDPRRVQRFSFWLPRVATRRGVNGLRAISSGGPCPSPVRAPK